ncbi:hypothetical protein LTR10_018329 [Elasticomyces elasticus]|nr:hypothetical protein LTR10_018329 [Elasticomyces elasticus]
MGKSSSDRRRSASELSSKPARRANDEDGPSRTRTDSQSMISSSRRKSSRPDPSYYGDDAPARPSGSVESRFAPGLTDEPSEISSTYTSQPVADDWEETPSRSQRVRGSERSSGQNTRRGDNDQYNDGNPTRRSSESSRRDSRRSSKTDRKSSSRGHGENEASLPQNQFPGEFPATYSQPYRPPGLAAEYYGDTGESVAFQPGVRPVPPSIVTNAEMAHLMEPTIEAKPPPEPSSLGAAGAAASYFGSDNFDDGTEIQSTPSKPSQKTESKTPSRLPAGGSYSGSAPFSSPADFAKPQQHSNAALYGSAALAGAAAGSFMNSQSHNEQVHNQHYHSTTHGPQGSFHGHSPYHSTQSQQVHRHRRRGPLGRLVDWFRDPDAVAEYEQYTEAIGVCKYCFDPMSSPAEAPRRHHYHRRVSSSGGRYGSSTRVDKMYRYSSDEERRKRSGTKKVVVGGLAGYRAAKVGDAILKSKHDFDETLSVKSGRPINRSRVGFQDEESGRSRRSRRYSSEDEARKQKYDTVRKTSKTSERHDRSGAHRHDASSSPSSRHGSRGAAISTAAGAAALAVGAASAGISSRRRSRSRSRSPSKKSYYSKRVSPMHSYVDLSATNTAPGGIASFFSSPSANKKRGQKSKGFFNFANASSSSSDADLAFGAATVRRKRSRKFSKENLHRRDSNAALIGLVATGEALSAESVRRQKKGKESYDADEAIGRSSRATNQQRISIHEDDYLDGHDDGWYDTDDDGNQSASSVDTALAYGEALSALQSRESLVQQEGYSHSVTSSRPSGVFLPKQEQEKRYDFNSEYAGGRHTSAPRRTTSGPSTEFSAAATMGYDGRTPLSSHSDLPPLRELEPRPVSDPRINDAWDRSARKNEPVANYIHDGTRVSSTSVPLQQPQPVTPVAPFLQDTEFGTTPVKAYPYDIRQYEPESASFGQPPLTQVERSVERERVRPGRRKDSNSNDRRDAVTAPSTTVESIQHSGRKRDSTDQPSSNTQQTPFDPADQRVSEIERELELLYAEQKQKERERKRRDRGSKDGVETAAAVGAAAAAAAASAVIAVKERTRNTDKGGSPPRRKSSLKQSKERQPSPPSETQQGRMERMKARPSRSATPSPVYEDYGSFFVPKELQEHLKEHNAKAEHRDDIGATVVEIIPGATRPKKPHSFDPDLYRPFGLDLDDDPTLFPWPVPLLSLIEPTPPGSQAHSVQGDASPVISPTPASESSERSRDPTEPSEGKSARGAKVTWGDHDTYVYEVATPEYEQTGYLPGSVTEEEKPDGPMPDIEDEATISVEDAEDVPTRPAVSRVWTLDEGDAEELEKEVSVVDDRPQISRAWTVDDSEADQIEHEMPNVRPNNQTRDEEAPHIIEVEPGQSQIHQYPQVLDENEDDVEGPAKMMSGENQTPSSVYRSPFAETVSDLGTSPEHRRHAQNSRAFEQQHTDDHDQPDREPRSSPGARVRKSEKRGKERANQSGEEVRAFDDPSGQGALDEHNGEPNSEPEVPGKESAFEHSLDEKGDSWVPLASGLTMGAAAVAASVRDFVTSASKPGRSDEIDESLDHQPSKTTEQNQSGPEECQRSKESKKSKKSKKSKRSSRDDAGVDRRPEGQPATDDAAFGTPARSSTLDDISELRDSGTAGSGGRKSKRKSKRRDAEPEESSDAKVRAAEEDEEGSIFSSNKSDVSTSSKKSSKSSRSNGRVDSGDDRRESRKKRSSREKDFGDVGPEDQEMSRRSRESVESVEAEDDQALSSRDRSVDKDFVSAEEIGDTIIKPREDDESFLVTRPEMPIPTVMDMPMETDGVSGPQSEYELSGMTGSGLEGSVESQRESLSEVSKRDIPLAEQEATKPQSENPEDTAFLDRHRMSEVDIIVPQQTHPLGTPQHAASRRLSAIRTADIPSSPVVTSSPTAVPLHFRRPPPSPTTGRFPMSSPMDSPSSPLTTPRTRQGRPKSTEFRSSTEFRPLYLVERQNFAKTATPETVEDYPSLPSSKTSSAHASMEDLRAEAQAQEEDYTPSRINAQMFRERGRRHSYSYWHDEKRRASPEYLDSRSATPVPSDAQRARDSERKSKPKYEFHSPSELLQDPSTYQEGPPADWDDGLASPLPSVLSADQDYMSARSRSLSPTRSRSLSHETTSRSGSGSTFAAWQDAIPTMAAAALAGSVLDSATYDAAKPAEENTQSPDHRPALQSGPVLPKDVQRFSGHVAGDEVANPADATLLSERTDSDFAPRRDANVEPHLSSVLTSQDASAPALEAETGPIAVPADKVEAAISNAPDTTRNLGDEPMGEAAVSDVPTPADDDFETAQENVPVGRPELSPFEQAFEAAVEARGLTESSTVEDALHVLQADDGEAQGGIPLTTIDEDTELPTPATEQEKDYVESDSKLGRKLSKKEKRKAKKGSKLSSNTDAWDTEDKSADQQELPVSAQNEGQPAEVGTSGSVAEDTLDSRKEQPKSFGDDLERRQDDPDPVKAEVPVDSGSRDIGTVVEETGLSGGPATEVSSTSDSKIEEDEWFAAPKTSKKDKKGKKSKKKQTLSWQDDEPNTGPPLETAGHVPAEMSREVGTSGIAVQDSSLADTLVDEGQLDIVAPVAVEQESTPSVAATTVMDATEPPETGTWEGSTKKGKKKSKRKSLAWADDADPVSSFTEGGGAVTPTADPELSRNEGDSGTTQHSASPLGERFVEGPADIEPVDADTRTEDHEKSLTILPIARIVDTEDLIAPPAGDRPAQQLAEDQPADDDWGFTTPRSTKKKDKKKRASKVAANSAAEASIANDIGEDRARPAAAEKESVGEAVEAPADTRTPTTTMDDAGVDGAAIGESLTVDDDPSLQSADKPEEDPQNNEKADHERELLPDDKIDKQVDRSLLPDTSLGEPSFDEQHPEMPLPPADLTEDSFQPAEPALDAEQQPQTEDDVTMTPTPYDRETQQSEFGNLAHPSAAAAEDNDEKEADSSAAAERKYPPDPREIPGTVDKDETRPSAPSQSESKEVEEDFGFSFKPAKTKKDKKGKKKRATLFDDFAETPVGIVNDKSTGLPETAPAADPVALPATGERELPVEPAEVPGAFPPATPEPSFQNVDEDDEFPMMTTRKSKKERRKKRQSVLDIGDSESATASRLEEQVKPSILEANGHDEDREISGRDVPPADIVDTITAHGTEAEEAGEHESAVHHAVVDRANASGGELSHLGVPTIPNPTANVPSAENTAAEAFAANVALPESPAREITAEETAVPETPADQPSSIVGFALRGVTGAMASAVKSIASVAPPMVEPPTVETPAVASPAVETPAVETPTVEAPVVETPAVETPAAEEVDSEPTKASDEATEEGWDFPVKTSKKDKKKKRQSALSSVPAEPQELGQAGETEAFPGDVQNVKDLEGEHTKDVVLDADLDTRNVLDDDWGVATKKTKKEKKKKRQSTFDTLDVQNDTPPIHGRETLTDEKALSSEDVQPTGDFGTEDPTITEDGKTEDRDPGTVAGDDQDDDFSGFTSKKSKKDKKKKRQSGLAAAADAIAGIFAPKEEDIPPASEDDPAATEVREQTEDMASPAAADIDADEGWAFTTTKPKDKKKKRKSRLNELSAAEHENPSQPTTDNADQAEASRGVEDSVPTRPLASAQVSLPFDEAASLHEPASAAEATTIEQAQPGDKSVPDENPLQIQETMPGAWSMSAEELAPAEDPALYKDPMPTERSALAQNSSYDVGDGYASPQRGEDDVPNAKEQLGLGKNEKDDFAQFEHAKNIEGNAGPGYEELGKVQDPEVSATLSTPVLTTDTPEQPSYQVLEGGPAEEISMLPEPQAESHGQVADDDWGFALKKSKKDKKKKRQATFDDQFVEQHNAEAEPQRAGQDILEPSNQSPDADLTTADLEKDAMTYDAPQPGVGPVEEEEWSTSKKSKKDKKKKKRQSTFGDSFAEEQSPAPTELPKEALFSGDDANAPQAHDNDARLATEAAPDLEPAATAVEDEWTSARQSKKGKKKRRAGDQLYVDVESEQPETLTSKTTQPLHSADIASGERSPPEDLRIPEIGQDDAGMFSGAHHHFDTTVSSSPNEHVIPPSQLEGINESGSRNKEELPGAPPPQLTVAGSDKGQNAVENDRGLVQRDEGLDPQRSTASIIDVADPASDPQASHDEPITGRPTFATEYNEPVEAAVLEPQVEDEWSTPFQKPKKGKKKKRQSTLQDSLGEPEEPQVRQVGVPDAEPAQIIEPSSDLLKDIAMGLPESSVERLHAEDAERLTGLKDTTRGPGRSEDDTMDAPNRPLPPPRHDTGAAAFQMEPSTDAGIDEPPLPPQEDWGFPVKKSKKKTKKEDDTLDARNRPLPPPRNDTGREDDTIDARNRPLPPPRYDTGDAAFQIEPSTDAGIAATRQDEPPLPPEEDWGFPVKKSKKKTKKTKSRLSNSEQATPDTETPGLVEQEDVQALVPRTAFPEPIQESYLQEETPATPAENAAEDYFAPVSKKKSKKDKKKTRPFWIENDEQSQDRALEPVNETPRDDEVIGDVPNAMGHENLPREDRSDYDQDVKKAHRLFEFGGTELQARDSTELDRNTADNKMPMDLAAPFDPPTRYSEVTVPQEDAETMSDVSASTRERRRRRRSPPAWSGEEPQDLPRNRALTPPPEHDDLMDTALGIAAGLGIGAGQQHESAREVTREPTSPARQLSSKWSFAQLGPVADRLNRDSGVQLESPLLAQGQISSTRDSGFVPDPAERPDGPYMSRDVEPTMDVSLRPPRPQSPTSSTEDVTQTISSNGHRSERSVLETPRRKPSPVAATSKNRSSALFNSSPAVLTPLDTRFATRSPEPVTTPLRRSPSIHGHHHSREQLRQLGKTGHASEYSDQPISNSSDRSARAGVNPSTHDIVTYDRPFSPRNSLNAIREEPVEGSDSHEMKEHGVPGVFEAAAGVAGLVTAGALSTRARDLGPARSLGTSKSRTSSLRNLRDDLTSPVDPDRQVSNSSRGSVDDKGLAGAATRDRDMSDVYDGYGSYPGSPKSPTRPQSVRRRQSIQQIRDLESRLDQLANENRALAEAKMMAEQHLEHANFERNRAENIIQASRSTSTQLQERDAEIARLKREIASLTATHETLQREHEQSLLDLQQHEQSQGQWQDSTRELEVLRSRHAELSNGMESIVRHEIDTALAEKNAEVQRLREDLEEAREKVRQLQSEILKQGADDMVVFHDEDYFDAACQKLCQQVQGWVLRFSKYNDLKMCRTTNEVRDEKIVDRFDNAILDGSDVDVYLADRVKRRDVFMSVVMTMIWEYVFTRYLFGMDREQRQKLKQLEKNLGEVGSTSAVHQWRALTLTLLSKRESFMAQRESDTEAVALEIFNTLSRFLPPPQNLEEQIVGSLRNVMHTAVDLSIEMRTQRAEYIMLPPLQPEYDTNGDLARKVYFNASLMNERSGETTSNEELEQNQAVVRMVLFPLVVKKGDDNGVGDDEIVVCPAQVLVARPDKGKRPKGTTRAASGGSDRMNIDARSLRAVSTHSLGAMSGFDANDNMF